MSTIWDVAKLAKVSKSTVSRVMNGGATSKEAKSAVLQAVEKLNYQPSYFAKNIRTQKSMQIAFMIPDSSNLFYTDIFKAIEAVAFEHEYMVTLCDTQNNPNLEIKYAKRLLSHKIDGLIYSTYNMDSITQNYFVNLSKTLPLIFMDYSYNFYPEISLVATEGFNSSRSAVDFLYNKGRRNIAYINFPDDVEVTKLRFQGYQKGLEDVGLPNSSELVYFPEPNKGLSGREIGFEGAKNLLGRGVKIDAIMTAADPLAVGAMKYLKSQNIAIPEQISVIGFDDNEICEIIEPSLSTIAQPLNSIGTVAAKLLMNKINNIESESNRMIFKGELRLRQST